MKLTKVLPYVIAVAVVLVGFSGLGLFWITVDPATRAYLKSAPLIRQIYEQVEVRRYCGRQYTPNTPEEVGDGRNAKEIMLHDPMGIGDDSHGNIYISDRGRFIWRIDRNGTARIIAGTGRRGRALVGTNALASDLGTPEGLVVDPAGRVYFSDSCNHIVLLIETDGSLTRVAGSARSGFTGDGGPAVEAELNRPFDVRLDTEGNLYIADYGNNRIRKVTRDGLIETVAGTGEPGYSGDHGPAGTARLNGPFGIFPSRDGGLLIADSLNHVIRRVDPAGNIETVAGTGIAGYTGDGDDARAATFDTPQSLYVDGRGRILIGDEHNHAVRMINPDGVISTLIGNGQRGSGGDGGQALGAQLNDPENILAKPDGSIFITDGDNRILRVIDSRGIVQTLAGRPPTRRP